MKPLPNPKNCSSRHGGTKPQSYRKEENFAHSWRLCVFACGFCIAAQSIGMHGFAQSYQISPLRFQVSRLNAPIQFPFLGGLNTPRIQFADLNHDQFLDLIVLDTGDEVLSFLTSGSREWRHRPSQAWDGPIQDWFLLKDLTGDAFPDLLTGDGFGEVLFYENSGVNDLWFLQNGKKDPVLRAEPGSQPALYDIDHDGDEDFFGGNSSGTISFFKNTGSQTQPQWQFETARFGGITVLLDTVIIESAAAKRAHGASAVQIFDYENDGRDDIFFGDFFTAGIYFLRNTGNTENPKFSLVTKTFPDNNPVQTFGLNQTTFATFDSLSDLLVSVNFPAADLDNFFHYENTGMRNQPLYRLRTKNFISTIDVGKRSHLSWADFNSDGLADFILGGEKGGIAAYQRDGDSSFHWVSDNWIAPATNLTGLAPTLLDLNNDGLLDAVVGLFDGTLRAYLNTGQPSLPLFAEDNSLVPAQDFGTFAVPSFGDFDRDGDQDLVVGTVNGQAAFLRNTGTPQSPSFTRITTNLEMTLVESFASPLLADWNRDGKLDLIVGSGAGTIRIWFQNQSTPELSFSPTPDVVISTDIRSIAPGFIVPRSDGQHDIIAGCERGGIVYLRPASDMNPEVPEVHTLWLHPNPAQRQLTLRAATAISEFEVFDILGRRVMRQANLSASAWMLNTSTLSAGVYLVRVKTASGNFVAKFVTLR